MTIKSTLNCIVTGGLHGIGRATANALHARGDRVVVFDVIEASDARVVDLVQSGISYLQVDISCVDAIKQAFSDVQKILQSNIADPYASNIDLLVNNAGITRDNLAIRIKEFAWDEVMNVNLKGAFFCAQEALKVMIRQKNKNGACGYIINISSVVALTGNPGQANYVASKAGLVGLTKTLAQEYGSRGVTVNAIAPGLIQTAMTDALSDEVKKQALERIPLQRFGSVDDVAQMVLFLSSGLADYVTGQVIGINGGMA